MTQSSTDAGEFSVSTTFRNHCNFKIRLYLIKYNGEREEKAIIQSRESEIIGTSPRSVLVATRENTDEVVAIEGKCELKITPGLPSDGVDICE